MLIVALIPAQFWLRTAYFWFALGISLLIAVEVMGRIGMGAQRWISVGGLTIQPSEFMKLAIMLALARYFHKLHPMDHGRVLWMIPPLLLMALPAAFILAQPNLGTTVILIGIALLIWFAAGLGWGWIVGALFAIAASIPLAWEFFLYDYQKQRVLTFLNPESDPLGSGYNIIQSMIAIGSGGLYGKGFVQGSQGQLDFLPEKHTDFIFTMLAEEFGFVGSVTLLVLFLLLIGYALGIAVRCQHRFGSLLAVGVSSLFLLHVMINVGMIMGLLPVVGVPLPFLSYGGTMLWTSCIAIGLLQNTYIHRDTRM